MLLERSDRRRAPPAARRQLDPTRSTWPPPPACRTQGATPRSIELPPRRRAFTNWLDGHGRRARRRLARRLRRGALPAAGGARRSPADEMMRSCCSRPLRDERSFVEAKRPARQLPRLPRGELGKIDWNRDELATTRQRRRARHLHRQRTGRPKKTSTYTSTACKRSASDRQT